LLALAVAAMPVVAGAADRPGCGAPFKVALDVGHTLSQPGATSATGVTEFVYNQRLALAVADALRRGGIATVVIGGDGGPMPLLNRPRLAQAAGASLFLSLHHDSVQPQYLSTWMAGGQARPHSDRFHGYAVFVSDANPRRADSLRMAALLGSQMRAAGFSPSLYHSEPIPGEGRPLLDATLGILRFDGLAVLRTAAIPAVLLEAAVIVNREEEAAIQQPATLDRMARAVAEAVRRYCGG
jgi:N-acetylmuramoyl-L-alanine amidase